MTHDEYDLLRQLANGAHCPKSPSPDLKKRIKHALDRGYAHWDEGELVISRSGRRAMLAYEKEHVPGTQPQPSTPRHGSQYHDHQSEQRRENMIDETASRVISSLFRLGFVYLLGVFTPDRFRIQIVAWVMEIIAPIIAFFD